MSIENHKTSHFVPPPAGKYFDALLCIQVKKSVRWWQRNWKKKREKNNNEANIKTFRIVNIDWFALCLSNEYVSVVCVCIKYVVIYILGML